MASFPKINAYTRNQPEAVLFPAPIVALRAPTANDIGYPLGQIWVYKTNAVAYILTAVASNVATWSLLEASGGAGVFSSLVVTGTSTLTGTTNINASGSAVTTIGTGGTGAVNIGNATGNTAVTGTLTTSAGITATTGNIVASAGNISASAGSLSAGTTVTAGTGLTVTAGNATLTNGNVVLSTAATFVQLPGPIKIMSGAGAPANGLAAEAGDLYIRTDPAGATSRIYVATAANTWTNVTCAA